VDDGYGDSFSPSAVSVVWKVSVSGQAGEVDSGVANRVLGEDGVELA
jgi:hypothetical protein